ncbi:hypothetical protein ACFCV3_33950 [Kribbella sp. NPDC056345]|uniref:hypothetical protein n=1 Tax=Kribbella sp. NPDC056345 TaxID=3345789 RepID=UPI0035E035AC
MRNSPIILLLTVLGRWAKYAPLTAFAVLVLSGVFGDLVVRDVVRWIGDVAGTDELVLRAAGWAWMGGPLVVMTVAFVVRRRLSSPVKAVLTYVMSAVAASSSMLLGHRGDGGREKRFGDVQHLATPLGYGWAAAVLSVIATVVLGLIVLLIVIKVAGKPLPTATQVQVGYGLGGLWIVLLAVSLWLGLTGPLPS